MNEYDVIIVGSSIAGCSAAILYAQRGLKVALIEKKCTSSNYYKIMCTHTIQASAVPIIEKLGILPALINQGAIFTHHQIWSKYGWIKRHFNEYEANQKNYGINISRKIFDPILLKETNKYSLISHFDNTIVEELVFDNNRVHGIKILNRVTNASATLFAKLIIGADGTYSNLAKLAKIDATINPNNRLGYFAYFKHSSFNSITASKMWYLEPDIAYAFINENGTMVLGYVTKKSNARNFKNILDESFISIFNKLPNSEIPMDVTRISKYYTTGVMKNIFRNKPSPGLVFIGDAALTVDPIIGVGIGYALQSAADLVNFTWKNLHDNSDYLISAQNYYSHHLSHMYDDYKIICNDSLANPFGQTAKYIFSSAVRDPNIANLFLDLCARLINTKDFFKIFQSIKEMPAKEQCEPSLNKQNMVNHGVLNGLM